MVTTTISSGRRPSIITPPPRGLVDLIPESGVEKRNPYKIVGKGLTLLQVLMLELSYRMLDLQERKHKGSLRLDRRVWLETHQTMRLSGCQGMGHTLGSLVVLPHHVDYESLYLACSEECATVLKETTLIPAGIRICSVCCPPSEDNPRSYRIIIADKANWMTAEELDRINDMACRWLTNPGLLVLLS